MNPEKPSRDEIEAKITALLLGELPDEEARLLRWTISQDAELTKLHDCLKATIGLVRHVSARPTEAAPLKLSDDRRKKLLAHFQTPRPQETFWVKQMKISPRFVTVLALIVITALLAAMLLPALSGSKSKSMTMSLQGEYGVTEDRLEPASPAEAEKKVEPPVLVTVAPVSQFSPPPSSAPPAPAPPPQSVAIYLPQTGGASQAQAPVQSGFQNAAGNLNAQNVAVNANGAANYGIAGSQQRAQSVTALPLEQRIVSNGVQTTPATGAESTSESEAAPSVAPVAPDDGVYSPSTVGYVNAKLPAGERFQTIQPETDNLAVTTSPSTAPVASAGAGSIGGGAGFGGFGGSGGGGGGGNVHYREKVEQQPKLPDTARQPYASFDGSTGSPTIYSPGHSAIVVTADNAAVPEGEFPVAPSGYVTTKDGRKVPVVGDMPLVGRLFSNNDNSVPAQPASGTTFDAGKYVQNRVSSMPAPQAIDANTGLPSGMADGDLSDAKTRNRSTGTPNNSPIAGRYTYGLYNYQEDTNSLALDDREKENKSLNDVAISGEAKDDHFVSRYAYTVSGITNYFADDLHQKAGNSSTQLYTKVLDVPDPEAIMSMAASVHSETSATNSSGLNYVTQLTLGAQVSGAARLYFKSQGVDLGAPGKGVFYSDRTGELVVKGTADDLAVVEQAFQSNGGETNPNDHFVTGLTRQNLSGLNDASADKQKLDQLEQQHQLFYSKLKAQTTDAGIAPYSMVQITAPAQPGKAGGLWDRLTGKVESTARVKVENEDTIIAGMQSPNTANYGYDPYFIQTTFEVIQSQNVLGKVVDKLNLQQKWAGGGEKLSKEDAVAMLKDRLTLGPVKGTKDIAITAESKDPKESAELANTVAEAYREYRIESSQQTLKTGLAALTESYNDEDLKIRQLQAQLNPQATANTTTMSLDDAIALYSKLTGRTILRSMIPLSVPVLVSNTPSGSDKDRELALQQALATANISLVNVGDNFVRVIPANGTGSATQASNNTEDLPLRQPAPNAPIPQPEVLTTDNAFSTFAMNVSDVSYKLAAASLEKGILPDASTIRSEEFINAFDYRDPEAAAGQPIAFNSERAQDPFEQNRDFLRFSIKTAAAGRQPGRPLNIVLLLDNSGSMERADRVEIIRESLRVLASQLEAGDTVSVVTFARTARLWLDGVPGNQAGDALKKVSDLTPQGGTNLEEAMRLAYETARRHYLANGMNRVVLLTDGAANLGNVDARILTQKVEDNRRQGIALDCFGIGWEDYNDDLLEQLTSHGDGRYAFLNSPADASSEFAAKLAGALQIAAEEVKVQVEFNPTRVIAYRQIGYAKHQLTKEQFRDNSVAAGEIAAQEAGNALYTMELKPDGSGPLATVRLRYRVPGTQDYRERSWNVDYTGRAPALDKSGPAMRLAVTAAEFAEWLATSPYAQQVTLDQLQNDLRGVPQSYGADPRPKQLEWMIRQAHSLAGKGGQY